MGDKGPTIDEAVFCRRLKVFQERWKEDGKGFGKADGVTAVVVSGAASDENALRYLKSGALQLWLFGYELPDTLLAFTKEAMHVVTSGKKASLLQVLVDAARENAQVQLHVHKKEKAEDGSSQIAEVIKALEASGDPPLVGYPKDRVEGKLATVWATALKDSNLATADITSDFVEVMAVKDQGEITNAKRAAFLAARVLKDFVVPTIEGIIDEEKKTKHSDLARDAETHLMDPTKLEIKLRKENVDVAFYPLIQSGGKFDLKVTQTSDNSTLAYDVIMVALGARYNMYCANVARTYLVDPSKKQEAEYGALLAAQQAALSAMVEGAKLSSIAEVILQTIKDKGQEHLIPNLTKSFGHGMGLELRDSGTSLATKSAGTLRAGMVFNLAIGASGLQREAEGKTKFKDYAFWIADTVLIKPDRAAAEVLTQICPKVWSDVAYYFKDEAQDEGQDEPANGHAPDLDGMYEGKKTNLRSEGANFQAQEADRQRARNVQDALLKKVNEETLRSLNRARENGDDTSGATRKVSDVVTYRSMADLPQLRDFQIHVDTAREAVLVPLYGHLVPFHILCVRNISSNQDGDHAYIRLNFNFGPSFEPCTKDPQAMLLKELSFRTSDLRHASKAVQEIKGLRSQVNAREKERAERATLVQQEALNTRGRFLTLPDVWIRPNFGGKGRKMTGQLSAHQNGFRYTTPKQERLDIMYRNIKHAFFQPAKGEMITLLHFHLRNPIMVAKKKTADVQFYTEVMDVEQTLDVGRRSMYDPDEVEEEQREREQRQRINKQFLNFTKKVEQDIWQREFGDLDLEFEVPFRELMFDGVPHKSAVKLMPTVNCLVELTEQPFTCITLAEVNIVSLERVGFSLKHFDLAIVFKDLTRDVFKVDAVPSSSLDVIRDWLTGINIKWYESKINLNWKPILKNIVEDPEGFIESGGWDFLNQEGDSGDEEDEDEEGDVEFQPDSDSDAAAESSEDGDSSEDESLASEGSDDEAPDSDADSEEEEGMDWDELEEEAMREDRARDRSDADSDEEANKRKRKGGGGGGSGRSSKQRRR
ncbi:hypothetical protein WJX73_010932 [Symbiochloris irregularis]|uniref:FACT complex subunit n=1 Tax=Symbiochloris irregularis TaxID=706552 RepID=A0AAW1PFY7_9CHLO